MWFLVILLYLIQEYNCDSNPMCSNRACIRKCCSKNQIVHAYYEFVNEDLHLRKMCKDVAEEVRFDNVTVLDMNFVPYNGSFDVKFDMAPGVFNENSTFQTISMDLKQFFPNFNLYLTEKGILIMEKPNAYERWTPYKYDRFCVDKTAWTFSKNDSVEYNDTHLRYWVMLDPYEAFGNDTFITVAMLISSVFLVAVLVVYGALPELRNLAGRVLMSYVACLLLAFVLLAVVRVSEALSDDVCVHLTCAVYFFFLSTFCWMNVMSYDIWWTFRGYAKARRIHRKGENFKFMIYCMYAFGIPLAMTIFLRVVNDMDLNHMPWFIKPNVPNMGCFITGGQKLVYMYIPMLILIMMNWLLYIMTAYNLWRLSRGTAVLDSGAAGNTHAHRTHKHRFLVYMKLSAVMGLNWVLEVVSFMMPARSWRALWWITDAYNIALGVVIFLIFVAKPTVLRKLRNLYKRKTTGRWVPGDSTKSNAITSNTSSIRETHPTSICDNPKPSTNNNIT